MPASNFGGRVIRGEKGTLFGNIIGFGRTSLNSKLTQPSLTQT
jgi:hypothetical protein